MNINSIKRNGSEMNPYSDNGEVARVKNLLKKGLESSNSLKQIQDIIEQLNGRVTDSTFNLSQDNDKTLDINILKNRLLIYPSTQEDESIRNIFDTVKISQFPKIKELSVNNYTVLLLSLNSILLSKIRFGDMDIKKKTLGSTEIFEQLGLILSKVYKSTEGLPSDIGFNKFALIPGKEEFIKLVNPLSISNISMTEVRDVLNNELEIQGVKDRNSVSLLALMVTTFKNNI